MKYKLDCKVFYVNSVKYEQDMYSDGVLSNYVRVYMYGYKIIAQIFGEPSKFGINNSRVSRLFIYKNNKTVFEYDRGLQLNKLSKGIVRRISSKMNKLTLLTEI